MSTPTIARHRLALVPAVAVVSAAGFLATSHPGPAQVLFAVLVVALAALREFAYARAHVAGSGVLTGALLAATIASFLGTLVWFVPVAVAVVLESPSRLRATGTTTGRHLAAIAIGFLAYYVAVLAIARFIAS